MPDAPAEQKAVALVYCGITYGKQGESEKEIADYTAVVQMPDAPAEQMAKALVRARKSISVTNEVRVELYHRAQ